MTHMVFFGQELPSGYRSAACSCPFIGLSYGSLRGPCSSHLVIWQQWSRGRKELFVRHFVIHFTKQRAWCDVRQTSDVVYLIHLLSVGVQPVCKESIFLVFSPSSNVAALFLSQLSFWSTWGIQKVPPKKSAAQSVQNTRHPGRLSRAQNTKQEKGILDCKKCFLSS